MDAVDGPERVDRRPRIVRWVAGWVLALACTGAAEAQQWNDPRALALVRQATDRRVQQLADSALVDYRATAHGYLTFLAQLGEGFTEPPRIVKADELALQLFWRAPNLSKQRVIGRRDTTLLPTDIAYHRDHLGIIQNNFPAIIRLGDGDEVRDVPHPLSPGGLAEYDFAISDSLRLTMPGRVIGVYEVKVRPRDDRQPRVIGALYLDRDNGQVVRMALSFTRAAFLDKQLEDLFVVLENGLVGTQFWLPRHQEIEIRRSATWLDYPVRGIIRGRWEISGYVLNSGLSPGLFAGPEIVAAPPSEQRRYKWPSARILDALPPELRTATAEEVLRVQAEARTLVREQALRRARGSALAARGLSDFVRFNRVEALSLGAGLSGQLGGGVGANARGRYGFADRAVKGILEVSWRHARGTFARVAYSVDFREVGDIAERSRLVNSIAAQELGSDFTNPFRVRAAEAGIGFALGGARWTLDLAREQHRRLSVNAVPAYGAFEPVVDAARLRAIRVSLGAEQPTRLGWLGTDVRGNARLTAMRTEKGVSQECLLPTGTCTGTTVVRASVIGEVERPFGDSRVLSRTFGAGVLASQHLHAQDLVYLGGPVSLPGYRFHQLVGDRAAGQRIELQIPIPFPSVGLGRFGRSGSTATLAPHATAAWVRQTPGSTPIARAVPSGAVDPQRATATGTYGSAGVSLVFGFDLLRLDVSRGLTRGHWVFSFDVSRAFWSVL